MYSKIRNIVIGFHGCDESTRDNIVTYKREMSKSCNDYDWLGSGFYFWENNPERALLFAKEKQKREPKKIKKISILGAFIDLGYCLDLLNHKYLELVLQSYKFLKEVCIIHGKPIPENRGNTGSHDLLLRNLDCAVIETLHQINEDQKLNQFDSVRGVFWEGNDLYPNAGFKEKNHIQICVRNPNCIKGFFIPKKLDSKYLNP